MPLTIDGTRVRLSCISRNGAGLPIVFLHGFGSTKEDYADVALHPAFAGRPIFAYDAPGCGESECTDLDRISIPFLVKTAVAALAEQGIDRFDLVGHSMGGLTSLMLAHQEPERVASFIDIEGNVAPEDCFLSRQISAPARGTGTVPGGLHRPELGSAFLFKPPVRHQCPLQGPRPGGPRDLRIHGGPLGQRPSDGKIPGPATAADVHVRRAEQDPQLPAPPGWQRCGPGGNPAQRTLPHVLQRSGDVAQDRSFSGSGE
ncbi:alpha/beta fold hydrolase [Pseudarthrobacter sp. NPDC058329]|uniref:alpha/beta fold hydrolase n=1 Tax=Pseudarthrobacter sp. NPDC058329 TaxID=3346448 RepID=UPI0036D99CB9